MIPYSFFPSSNNFLNCVSELILFLNGNLEFMFWVVCRQKGAVGVKQPYIRVVGMEQTRETNSSGPSNFTLDEVSCYVV